MESWLYNDSEFLDELTDGYVGFIYLITNTINNKQYIGKKIFTNTLRIRQKNKTRRKVKRKESDWKDYYGSSPSLSLDIVKYGKSVFRREIIRLCKSKSELTYFEAKEQFARGCLETPGWYNEHIMCRVRKAALTKAFPSSSQG